MALDATILADLQGDLGISTDQTVFTDAELERLYLRAASDYSLAMVYGLRQLLMDAAKLNDYKAGQSSESKGQVFDHLKAMLEMWAAEAGVSAGKLTAGVIDLDFVEKGPLG